MVLNDQNLEYIMKIQQKFKLNFSNASILDIGIGGGYLAKKFLKQNKNVKYTGVDIDCYLPRETKGKVKLIKADLNHLPVIKKIFDTQKKYDYIFIFDVLEHLIHFHYILNNMHKLLSKKGFLIMSLPIDINLSTKIRMVFQDSAFSNPFTYSHGHINLFSLRQLESGLRNIKALKVVDLTKCGLGYGLYDKTYHLNMLAKLSPALCGRVYLSLNRTK